MVRRRFARRPYCGQRRHTLETGRFGDHGRHAAGKQRAARGVGQTPVARLKGRRLFIFDVKQQSKILRLKIRGEAPYIIIELRGDAGFFAG